MYKYVLKKHISDIRYKLTVDIKKCHHININHVKLFLYNGFQFLHAQV